MSQNYKFTGKQIPIDVNELKVYINQQLDNYDKGENSKTSPYIDPIIYTFPDKKQIEIPKDIQMSVIEERQKNKQINQNNIDKHVDEESNSDDEEDVETSGYGSWVSCILLFILIIVACYIYKVKYY